MKLYDDNNLMVMSLMSEISELRRLTSESLHGKKFKSLSYEEKQLLAKIQIDDKQKTIKFKKGNVIYTNHVNYLDK